VREVYDEEALKRGIWSDNIFWLIAEEEGRIVGSGALVLGIGDYNDQIGELGRLVVHPGLRSKGLARRLADALVAATGERVEFAFAETRTVHAYSQKMADGFGMGVLGFLPMAYRMAHRESFVVNGQLYGNGRALREPGRARVVPAVASLARLSLANLGLEEPVGVAAGAQGYPPGPAPGIAPLDGPSLLRILRIEQGRIVEPEVFGGLHVDQGLSQLRARDMHYFVAAEGERTLGAVGYGVEAHDRNVRITELIGAEPAVKGALLAFAAERAVAAHGAELVLCDVAAEVPAVQQTLLDLGFLPAAYLPGMVFHGTRRHDVVRFVKLLCAWEPGDMALVESSRAYHDLVVPAFAARGAAAGAMGHTAGGRPGRPAAPRGRRT
jgi:GNAT superfamily N-acetyltransferase